MAAPVAPAVWSHFMLNILLQIFDGVLTYHVLCDGVPEANPLVSSAIAQWGSLWGLLYWKIVACALLGFIFALRHRRRSLAIKALALTAAVYAYVSIAGVSIVLLKF
jgi:hypothetical protein